jgi:hypothetical protein
VFVDKASRKLASPPELDKALMVARGGDQLVVTKLDRLGRSVEHLSAAWRPECALECVWDGSMPTDDRNPRPQLSAPGGMLKG